VPRRRAEPPAAGPPNRWLHWCPFPGCQRLVRWALLFCFDCNREFRALQRGNGKADTNEEEPFQFPPYQAE